MTGMRAAVRGPRRPAFKGKKRAYALAAMAAAVVCAGLLRFAGSPRAAELPREGGEGAAFGTAVLPERCKMSFGLSLRQLLAQPSFARQASPQMVLSSVLSRTPAASEVVDYLFKATRSGSLDELGMLRVCRERVDDGFIATLHGELRRGVLTELVTRDPLKWSFVTIGGVQAVARTGRRAPFYAQAEDGSLLVASSEDGLVRALERSKTGGGPAPQPGDAGVWASVSLADGKPGRGGKAAKLWEHAKSIDVSADFTHRAFTARLEADSPEGADLLAKQLRTLVATALSNAKHEAHGAGAVLYLVQRARISVSANTVVVDSELSADALGWLAGQLANQFRAQQRPPS
jgi:hypothetical protein